MKWVNYTEKRCSLGFRRDTSLPARGMSLMLLEVQGEEIPGRDVDRDALRSSLLASPSTPRTRPISNSSWWTAGGRVSLRS